MRWVNGGQRRESGFLAAIHRRKPVSEKRRFFRPIRQVNGSLFAWRYSHRTELAEFAAGFSICAASSG